MKLSILTPIGYNASPYYFFSIMQFQEYCRKNNIELEYIHNRMSNIFFSREDLIDKATGDYILWIDSDASFTPDHFEKLVSRDKAVVCCVAKFYDHRIKSFKWNFGWYMPQGYDSLGIWSRNPLCGEDIGTELLSVDYTGCHFALIKKEVISKLTFPRFDPLPMNLIHKNIKGYMSEDGAFYYKIKQAGYEIFVDPSCHVLHHKDFLI